MVIIIKLLINSLAIFFTAQLIPQVQLDSIKTAVIVAIVLGFMNAFIKPVLLFFTLPLTVLTLGLFTFVVNALIILLTDYLVEGFAVPDFITALIFALVLSIISTVLTWIVK